MNVYQATKVWASLSHGRVEPASGHLPRDDKNDAPNKKDGRALSSGAEKQYHILLGSHFSTDSRMNVGVASVGPETRWGVW